MGSGLHWILFLLENIRKEQGCHVSRYQILKVRIGVEGKMACQKEEQCFSEAEPCRVSRVVRFLNGERVQRAD